jgi:hypothetical protein
MPDANQLHLKEREHLVGRVTDSGCDPGIGGNPRKYTWTAGRTGHLVGWVDRYAGFCVPVPLPARE